MYRLVMREQVVYGQFREYLEIAKEMAAYAKDKGWGDPVLMAPTVGAMNEAEVASLAGKLDALPAGGALSNQDLILILIVVLLVVILL